MDISQLKKMKDMESALARHKKMYVELAFQNTVLKDVIEKKLYGLLKKESWQVMFIP